MSFFGKMFGGKKEEVKTTGEAIQKLRETEEMLLKKQVNIYYGLFYYYLDLSLSLKGNVLLI